MWEFICLQNVYWWTYKTASRPTGLDGIGVFLDGYDASNGKDTVIQLNLYEALKKTNEGEVNLKIRGNL